MENVAINTTQNVVIDYEIASVGDRILATLLDYLFFLAYFLFFVILQRSGLQVFDEYVSSIIIFLPILFYDLLCESMLEGQSFGKKIIKIKVTTSNGTQPSLGQYIIRWAFRLIDMRIFSPMVALVAVAASGKGKRLGDMAAGTTVIKQKQRTQLQDTILHTNQRQHQITFTEVANLSGQDISIIKDVLQTAKKTGKHDAVAKLTEKVKATLNIKSEMPDFKFIETILADYSTYQFKE